MNSSSPMLSLAEISVTAQRKQLPSKTAPPVDRKYALSQVEGGQELIYNFKAPPEYLNDSPVSEKDKRKGLIYYFQHLYPVTSLSKWESMSTSKLVDYYKNLDFWYTFNTYWGVAPKPVVFDDSVIAKWEKNTFYQPNTIVQSSITSLSWDLDATGKKFYYAGRINNASQVDPALKFNGKVLRTVCRSKDYWESMRGKKLEVTNWGWNPYPFGVYLQGPFKGTGTFLELPEDFVLGTCHWSIIMANKNNIVPRTKIFKVILDHELSRIIYGSGLTVGGTLVTPWVILREGKNSYKWSFLMNNTNMMYGSTPLLFSYSCYLIGGFGGAGGFGPPYGNTWKNNTFQYMLIFERDSSGNYVVAADQGIAAGDFTEYFPKGRKSDDTWNYFDKFFELIESYDTNYAQNIWRHPLTDNGFGPSVANPCDDLMQAFVTGNFDFVNYSIWGLSNVDPSLSKNTPNKLTFSNSVNKFPYGYVTGGKAPSFVVRTQMPNVNGDICVEFADFRVCTSGQLATGSGNQKEWVDLLTSYAANYLYCADPEDTSNAVNLKGEYEPWFPDVSEKSAQMSTENFVLQDNPLGGKTFFDFDVYMGQWVGNLAYTNEKRALPQLPMNINNYMIDSWVYSGGSWSNVYNSCTNKLPALTPPAVPGTELDIRNNFGDLDCLKGKSTGPSQKNMTYTQTDYYPFATDSFATGVVGYQANNYTASIGSAQTRWCCNSKKVAWKFEAPVANSIMLNSGLRLQEQAQEQRGKNSLLYVGLVVILILFVVTVYLAISTSRLWLIGSLVSLVLLFLLIFYGFGTHNVFSGTKDDEAHRLRLYLSLIYPATPVSKWNSMNLDELRKFYLSLHMWYRTDNKNSTMPKPTDYIDKDIWNKIPPFGPDSKWKNWTIRKYCVTGYPQVHNPYDGKLAIGNDGTFGVSVEDAPTTIMFRDRQILSSDGANVQNASFFQPANNYYIDNFNCHAGVNNTSIEYWENAKYAEVSSQWGPFPDGSYHDWGQGSGIFMKLGKHIVGYTGLHVVYKLGLELLQKPNYHTDLEDCYFQEWQRTGIDGMTITRNLINNPGIAYNLGLYGSIIFTKNQREQVIEAVQKATQSYDVTYADMFLADGSFWGLVNNVIQDPTPYYDCKRNTWVKEIPKDLKELYVTDYPFPLPFRSNYDNRFQETTTGPKGHPAMWKEALSMPWKYQCFNIAFMFRNMVIDLLFLDEKLSTGDGTSQEYVDWLIACSKNPLKKPRTWKDAIDILVDLLGQTPIHPIFFKYTRTLLASNPGTGLQYDGPIMILAQEGAQSLNRIQTGALDKTTYLQSMKQSKGVYFKNMTGLPQMAYANLEIDHWMSEMACKLNYDTIQRIQHWSGSKNMSADIELINLRVPIPGNLIDNTLSGNIYEVWRKAFEDGWYVLRDPFDSDSHVYPRDGDNSKVSNKEMKIDWCRPPWIGYDPKNNLYGWYPESLNTYNIQNRLAYPQMGAMQIGLSHAYPEYNHYIWEHMIRNY